MVPRSLCSLASELLRWLESVDVHLDAMYLPRQSSVLVDLLSCRDQVIGTEWSLHLQVTRDLPCRSICSRRVSTRSFPYTVPLSRIPRRSLRMRFVILGPTWTCTVSTLSSGRKGGGSSQRDPQSLHNSGRPPLAREGVACRPSLSTDPTTSGASVVGPVVVTSQLQQVLQRHPRPEPSCVVTLQCLLRKSGFSRGSAVEMSGCVRTSTSQLYQKWMLFCG